MTIHEASVRYKIPMDILKEYESWGLCGTVPKVMGAWHYDDEDLERLGLIMTLHDMGFTSEEVETYMRLTLEQRESEQKRLQCSSASVMPYWIGSTFTNTNYNDWITCAMKSKRTKAKKSDAQEYISAPQWCFHLPA